MRRGGMGRGMGRAHMGCGRILRDAISTGKIDEQLVQSLLIGPSGDAQRGKQVFAKNCSVCHKLGSEGEDIAPDLTNTPRHNPIYLLANLANPSAIIPQEYQVYVVMTDAGRIVTGFVIEENAKAITILDAQNQRTERV
jgi:putative heme-binding domain-containing protein